MKTLGDDNAYPLPTEHVGSAGLTKREYFAAMAMQGFIIRDKNEPKDYSHNMTAILSIEAADRLIHMLNKENIRDSEEKYHAHMEEKRIKEEKKNKGKTS